MKFIPNSLRSLTVLLCALVSSAGCASETVSVGADAASPPALLPNAPPSQLELLLGPVALYPDPLLGLILPASTQPYYIARAAEFVRSGGTPEQAAERGWDEPIVGLCHYPEVLFWLDERIQWVADLGQTYQEQPEAVMAAVQSLRSRALAAGELVSTPEQTVSRETEYVVIEPTTSVIYVPYYDPHAVFFGSVWPRRYSSLSFSIGFRTGGWLSYGCDWGNWRVQPRYYAGRWDRNVRHDRDDHRDHGDHRPERPRSRENPERPNHQSPVPPPNPRPVVVEPRERYQPAHIPVAPPRPAPAQMVRAPRAPATAQPPIYRERPPTPLMAPAPRPVVRAPQAPPPTPAPIVRRAPESTPPPEPTLVLPPKARYRAEAQNNRSDSLPPTKDWKRQGRGESGRNRDR